MQSLGLKYSKNGIPQIFNLGYIEFGINTPVAEGYTNIIRYLTKYENNYTLKLL